MNERNSSTVSHTAASLKQVEKGKPHPFIETAPCYIYVCEACGRTLFYIITCNKHTEK